MAQAVSHDAPCAVAVVRGIAADDASWIDTGAYDKVEPVPITSLVAARGRGDDSSSYPTHIMPAGM